MATRSHDNGLINDINVTPFVDILLVLLIIFMVVAPAISRSVGVNLPKEQAVEKDPANEEKETEFLVIGLDKDGNIVYEKKKFELQHFFERFGSLTQDIDIEKIFIEADKESRYENVLKLMVFLKNRGHGNLGFVFDEK